MAKKFDMVCKNCGKTVGGVLSMPEDDRSDEAEMRERTSAIACGISCATALKVAAMAAIASFKEQG